MQTVFSLVKVSMECLMPSLATPDCLKPPKGISRLRTSQQLFQTVPTSNSALTRWMVVTFSDQTRNVKKKYSNLKQMESLSEEYLKHKVHIQHH